VAEKGGKKDKGHYLRPLEDYWADTMVCTYCGFCKSVCPPFRLTRDDTKAPRSKVIISFGILSGELEPEATVRDALFSCSTCMDCQRRCPSKVKTLDMIIAARRLLVLKGLIPTAVRQALDNIAKEQNPIGEPGSKRAELIPEEALARVGKGAEVLVFLGCNTAYTEMKITKYLFEIMERAKVDYTTLGKDEPCCGMLNYLVGLDVGDFAKTMKVKLDGLKPRPKTIVTPCPGCFRSLAQNYPAHEDLGVNVKHTIQFFLELLGSGKLKVKKRLEGMVLYHDPCDLGRHTGIYDEPRKLLSYFTDVGEFQYNKELSRCCGGGGGLMAFDFEMSVGIAKARLLEAIEKGADIIVTACPSCEDALSAALQEVKKETGKALKVVDLTEIIYKNTTGE
jgi:glycolate oxidase